MSIKSFHDPKTFSQQKIEKETVNECLFVMSLSILQLNLFYGISIILLNSQKRESMKLQLLECAVALQTIMQRTVSGLQHHFERLKNKISCVFSVMKILDLHKC